MFWGLEWFGVGDAYRCNLDAFFYSAHNRATYNCISKRDLIVSLFPNLGNLALFGHRGFNYNLWNLGENLEVPKFENFVSKMDVHLWAYSNSRWIAQCWFFLFFIILRPVWHGFVVSKWVHWLTSWGTPNTCCILVALNLLSFKLKLWLSHPWLHPTYFLKKI